MTDPHVAQPVTLPAGARERLARRLYMKDCGLEQEAAHRWDTGDVPAAKVTRYERLADELLAAIADEQH